MNWECTQLENSHSLIHMETLMMTKAKPSISTRYVTATHELHVVNISLFKEIYSHYFTTVLPSLLRCNKRNTENASAIAADYERSRLLAAECDFACLRAISQRIHYGIQVAAAKFKQQKNSYEPLIAARDSSAIMDLLTDSNVERLVLERVAKKAQVYSSLMTDELDTDSICNIITTLYKDFIIPVTKEVEVQFFLSQVSQHQG